MNHALRTGAPALRAVFAATALVAASAAAPAASPLVDLGTLGGTSTYGYDINDSGVVVGYETDAASVPTTAFRWTAATGIVPLSAIGAGTKAVAVNAAGDAVGSDATHALYWAAGTTTATVLPDLGGSSPVSTASGINAAGQIVGTTVDTDPVTHLTTKRGFITTTAGPAAPVGPAEDNDARPVTNAVNDAGTVVGSDNSVHAFAWTAGSGVTDLGVPVGVACSINNSGVITGFGAPDGTFPEAFVAAPGQAPRFLPSAPASGAFAYDVNDAGYVVGSSFNFRAVLWNPADYDAAPVDLDAWFDSVDPVDGANWQLTYARAINNAGQVVGYGTYNDGPGGLPDGGHAFVLDVSSLVPEPASLAFPLLAAAMAFRTPRRRRNA
jgi:probable HAF family extracellular repeat protein